MKLLVIKRLAVLLILGTAILAQMDWQPIHYQWWHNGQWPSWAGENFQQWSSVRTNLGTFVCPPCAALAEPYYFSLLLIEAGSDEQAAVLKVPADLQNVWWGQGPDRPWRPVPWVAWFAYWVPKTTLWWWLYAGDLLRGRLPWWIRWLRAAIHNQAESSKGRQKTLERGVATVSTGDGRLGGAAGAVKP